MSSVSTQQLDTNSNKAHRYIEDVYAQVVARNPLSPNFIRP